MSPPPVLGTIMVLYSGTMLAQPCLLGFCESYGDPNSGPHTFTASALLTELSPQSYSNW